MAWDFIAVSTYVEQNGGNITLNAPTGAQQGDLLVACIAYRSTESFTPNDSAWNLVATQQSSGDTDATQGIASGVMYYCIRGASNPGFQFNRTNGDVAQGTVLCYRGGASSNIYDTGNAATLGTIGEPSLSGITTANANELIIAMISHGDNSLCSAVDAATAPSVASGDTDTTTDPTADTWIERFDRGSNTGADTGLCVADGLKSSAGSTGTFSADAVTTTRSVFIVGAFKIGAQTYLFPMASTGESLTASAAALPVVRVLPLASTGESLTSAPVLSNILKFPTIATGESVTANTAVLSIVRAFSCISTGESVTSGTVVLSVLRMLLWASTGESLTSDASVLGILRSFLYSSVGESNTSLASLNLLDYVRLQLSDYISGSAADPTTARLTAPVGKSFQAGKISDDTNPLPSIDLDANKYTEIEWCLFVTSAVGVGDQYEFRVTAAGTAIDTYDQTPKISIGNTYTFLCQSTGETEVASNAVLNIIRNLAWLSEGESLTSTAPMLNLLCQVWSSSGESLTSNATLTMLRNMIYSATGESLTGDTVLSVLRDMIWSAIGESTTANADLILPQTLLFLMNVVGESFLTDPLASVLRLFTSSSCGESLTSDSLLSVLRTKVFSVVGESLISDSAVLNILRVLSWLSIGESVAADSAVMGLLRSILWVSTGESLTADATMTVEEGLLWLFLFGVVGESLTATPSFNVVRPLIFSSVGESDTVSTVLSVLRIISQAAVGESVSADYVLSVLRPLLLTPGGESLTSAATMTLLRRLFFGVIGESHVSDATLSVFRKLLLSAIGESLSSSPELYFRLLGIINNPSLLLTTLKRRVLETGLLDHSIIKLSDPSAVVQEAVQTLKKINERRITTLTPTKVIDLVTAQKVIQGD